MKKFYSLLLAALCAVPSISAQEGRLYYGYSGDNINGIQVPDSKLYGAAAICIPASQTAEWQDCTLWGVQLGFGSGRSKEITIFLSYDLDEAPFYTYDAKVRQLKHWNEYTLPDAPVIDAGKDLYVGYYISCTQDVDYMMGFDNNTETNNRNSALVAASDNIESLWGGFSNKANRYGAANIRAIIAGDNIAKDKVDALAINPPMYVQPGTEFPVKARLRNVGSNYLSSFDVTVTVGNQATTHHIDLTEPVGPNTDVDITVPGCSVDAEQVPCPVVLAFDKINDNPSTLSFNGVTAACEPIGRAFVMEEETGAPCSWCVRGLYMMEVMREKYYGTFFPLAIHCSNAQYDQFFCEEYRPWVSAVGIKGLPSCVINRGNVTDPRMTIVEPAFKNFVATTPNSPYRITVNILSQENGVAHVRVDLFSAYDNPDANMAFTLVAAEDKITYMQQNAYSGDTANRDIAGHFVDESGYTSVTADDVVRSVVDVLGIDNSVPGELEAGKTYSFEADVPISNIDSAEDTHISALLLNLADGSVLNAGRTYLDGRVLGAKQIEADKAIDMNAPIEYFDLSGRRISADAAAHGIYIMRQGSRTMKIAR